ncbi:hypothetical protein TPENAI_70130 [Tenacibaculum litopenaei]
MFFLKLKIVCTTNCFRDESNTNVGGPADAYAGLGYNQFQVRDLLCLFEYLSI